MTAGVPRGVLNADLMDALHNFGPEPGLLLEGILRDFLLEAPALVLEIESAVALDAYVVVAGAAHRLKGSSGQLGATRLALVASDVETAARADRRDAAAAAAAALRIELDLATAALRALLASRTSPSSE
jgi:HPt (histidine-containing phosphotransfer) domain-containing protein